MLKRLRLFLLSKINNTRNLILGIVLKLCFKKLIKDAGLLINNRIKIQESYSRRIIRYKKTLLREIGDNACSSTIVLSNHIRMLIDMMKTSKVYSDEVQSLISQVMRSSENLTRYFRNVKDLIRYSDGKFLVGIQRADLRHFLEVIVHAYGLKHDIKKTLVLRYNSKESMADFDPFKIEQLFDNIFAYIAKFDLKSDVIVQTKDSETFFLDSILEAVLVSIKLQNISILEDEIKVFDSQGLLKIIADFHHAKIWIENEVVNDKSNILINILLPSVSKMKGVYTKAFNIRSFEENMCDRLQREELDLENILEEQRFIEFTKNSIKPKINILFIDENQFIREYAKITLIAMGYSTDIIDSYQEAITKLKSSNRYDIVIMDIFSEEDNGNKIYTICQICKKNDIPIVFHVGYNDGMNPITSDSYKKNHILLKPYNIKEIHTILSNIVPYS